MIAKDKLKHLIVGGMLSLLYIFQMENLLVWFIILAICVGKEVIWDDFLDKGTPEIMDIVYGMIIPTIVLAIIY